MYTEFCETSAEIEALNAVLQTLSADNFYHDHFVNFAEEDTPSHFVDTPLPEKKPGLIPQAVTTEIEPTASNEPKILPMTPSVMSPGGLLGDITEWINTTAIKPQPVLALAAAIAAAGTMMGRKVQTSTGLRTNLLIVSLGETSCGKEHPRQCVKRLFWSAEYKDALGPEELASDAGLLRSVYKNPAQVIQIDEIGYMLRAITDARAKPHLSGIAATLMKLDSAANTIMVGRAYADPDRPRDDIVQPNVCLHGSSVPSRFLQALTPDEILDGFVPRMIVFEAENPNPMRQNVTPDCPPIHIIEKTQLWRDMDDGTPRGSQPRNRLIEPNPRVIPFTAEALELFNIFEVFVRSRMEKIRLKGLHGLWGKTEAMAMRCSLIHACSLNPYAVEIGVESARWAIEMLTILTHNMEIRASGCICANELEADTKKVLKKIYDAGPKGVMAKDLRHSFHRIPMSIYGAVLESLILTEEIYAEYRAQKNSGRGKAGRWFVATCLKDPKEQQGSQEL